MAVKSIALAFEHCACIAQINANIHLALSQNMEYVRALGVALQATWLYGWQTELVIA